MDTRIIAEISELRKSSDVIIDSHALTREEYGFRAIPFSAHHLSALQLDALLVLRCDPEVLLARVAADRGGRREMSVELAREIQLLQESVCLNYAVQCGCPFHVIDTSKKTKEEVESIALGIMSMVGMTVIKGVSFATSTDMS